MSERAGGSRLKLFVLLEMNRLVLTAALAVGVFLAFVVAVTRLEASFVEQLGSGDMIDSLFTTMVSVVVTGTTLVVTIGQLVLTQETGPLGDQHDRMDNAMAFREVTAEVTREPSPTDPGEFLAAFVEVTVTRSETLRDELDRSCPAGLRDEIETFVASVLDNAQGVSERLEGAEFGQFEVLSAALGFNYGWKIARIEQFEHEYADELAAGDLSRLEDLKAALSLFGPAREHVKTLYFQWALIDLSRLILYAAIPAVVVASIMVAIVGPSTLDGTLLGVEQMTFLVGGAFTVTLLPFLVFVSYILRILTVAKRTLAIEPLILR